MEVTYEHVCSKCGHIETGMVEVEPEPPEYGDLD